MTPIHVRVFLSSPGDVHDERSLARKVIESLPKQPFIKDHATLELVSWDDPDAPAPVYANLTPQEALRRHIRMPSECDVVVTVLWGRLGTPLPADDDFYRKKDGGRYLSGTEWEFDDAVRARKDVLLYRRSEKPVVEIDDPERESKAAQYSLVNEFFQRFTNTDRSLNGLWRTYATPSEFERLLDNDLRAMLERLFKSQADDGEWGQTSRAPEVRDLVPYPGLRRLTEQDAAIFFGRGAEVDALIKLIASGHRFISVIGASGSGKSSLVRAGLLPRLRGNAVTGSKDWKFLTIAPGDLGDNPSLALAVGLAPIVGSSPTPVQLAAAFAADKDAAARCCEMALAGSPEWAKLTIFIDQLEELFTNSAPEYRDGFVRTIEALAAEPRVVLLSTLRADFFSEATNWGGLTDLIRVGNYLLLPPGLKALSDIIALPAATAGVEVEPTLLEQIIQDAGLQPGTLPLLAYTLEQLYAGRHARVLTRSDYQTLGGIQGAISKRADESLRILDASTTAQLPSLFRQLLTINDAGIVTRRRVRQRDVVTTPETATLMRTLVDARLLIADVRDGEKTIEVAHEALFAGWDQMRRWIDENREFLLWRNRLRMRLDDWLTSGRDENGALRGGPLQEALKWLERHAEDLTDEERDFIRWPLSDAFQIRGLIATARTILESSFDQVSREQQSRWLTALIVAEEHVEVATLIRIQPALADVFPDAAVEAVTLLARAGKLGAAKATAARLTGFAKSEGAARIAEIAASSGKLDMAADAALLIDDKQLATRAMARAVACTAPGANRQFTIEALSNTLSPPSARRNGTEGQADADWETMSARAKAIASPILRAGALATTLSAFDREDTRALVAAVLQDVQTAVDDVDESYWHGLIAVRVADALAGAGRITEAEQIATRIPSDRHRAGASALLARHRLSRCEYAEAFSLCLQSIAGLGAGAFEPAFGHVIAVAGLLGCAGHAGSGKKIALYALHTLDSRRTTHTASPYVLARVAQVLALCDATDDAVTVLTRISAVAGRAEAFRAVARALAQAGLEDRVMELAQRLSGGLERAELLACAADISSGDSAATRSAAAAMLACLGADKEHRRLYARCVIASASSLIKANHVPELLHALRVIEGKQERVQATLAVMERLAIAGRTAEAQELVTEALALIDRVDDHDQRARVFAQLAQVMAHYDRIEEAYRTARRCHVLDNQLAALTEIFQSWICRDRLPGLRSALRARHVHDEGENWMRLGESRGQTD